MLETRPIRGRSHGTPALVSLRGTFQRFTLTQIMINVDNADAYSLAVSFP